MAQGHDDKGGIFWSLVSLGIGILAALVVGWLVGKLFSEGAAGIIFGGVTFLIVTWVASQRLGPPADDAVAHAPVVAHHAPAAPVAAAPVAAPVAPVAAPVAAPVVERVAAPVHDVPAPDSGAVSERVREAARAAREALGDLAPAGPAVRPATLAAPLDGGADNLMRLKGVGPKFAEMLNANGVYHFSQIAAWGPSEIAWIEGNIEGFTGRVVRDDWVGQSKILAAGGETEHSQRVDRGEST